MPPVVIGAGIAAAGAVGAAAIGSKSASKAAKTQAAGNDAAIASQERGRAEAAAALAPWQQAGLQANGLLQSALGFGTAAPAQTPAQSLPAPQPNALYQGINPDTSGGVFGRPQLDNRLQQAQVRDDPIGSNVRTATAQATAGQPATSQTTGQAGQNPANAAFNSFLNSINYNWQLQQGQNALNGGYAGAGTLQSGAAIKAFGDYNQNMARGAYQDWYGGVENMANRGYGAAAAQAGVSTNTANNISNLNSANANALAQLQIAKGNNTASLIGGLGQIGGYVAGNVLTGGNNNNAIIANVGGSRYSAGYGY